MNVQAIIVFHISGSPGSTPKWKHNARPKEAPGSVENLPATERTDLLIMGMIRDEKEKKFHKAHQVRHCPEWRD